MWGFGCHALWAWAAGAFVGLAGAVAQGLFATRWLTRTCWAVPPVPHWVWRWPRPWGRRGMLGGGAPQSSLAIGFSSSLLVRLGLTGAAFLGSVAAIVLTLVLSRGVGHTLRLLLAGVIVGAVLGAVTHLVLMASPDSLQAMGPSCLVLPPLWDGCRWRAHGGGLAGEPGGSVAAGARARRPEPGRRHGPKPGPARGAHARGPGGRVGPGHRHGRGAQTGLIAFVGWRLRILVRSAIKTAWPAHRAGQSGGRGAADGRGHLARWLVAPQELPVGVLTAVLGGATCCG